MRETIGGITTTMITRDTATENAAADSWEICSTSTDPLDNQGSFSGAFPRWAFALRRALLPSGDNHNCLTILGLQLTRLANGQLTTHELALASCVSRENAPAYAGATVLLETLLPAILAVR